MSYQNHTHTNTYKACLQDVTLYSIRQMLQHQEALLMVHAPTIMHWIVARGRGSVELTPTINDMLKYGRKF